MEGAGPAANSFRVGCPRQMDNCDIQASMALLSNIGKKARKEKHLAHVTDRIRLSLPFCCLGAGKCSWAHTERGIGRPDIPPLSLRIMTHNGRGAGDLPSSEGKHAANCL